MRGGKLNLQKDETWHTARNDNDGQAHYGQWRGLGLYFARPRSHFFLPIPFHLPDLRPLGLEPQRRSEKFTAGWIRRRVIKHVVS